MGTFEGHALPGSFFFVFGVWWFIKFSYRFIRDTQCNGKQVENDSQGKWARRAIRFNLTPELIEGMIIVVMTIVGFICEQSWPYKKWKMFDYNTDPPGNFVNGAEWQHCTMYVFFGIYGAAMIMARTCVTGLKEYETFFLALALFVEGILFYFHVHGRSFLDITVHYMLVIAVFIASAVSLGEVWMKKDRLLPFLRSGLSMVQGTWFWHVGFILYPPNSANWDEENHSNVMFATMAFCWHIAANIFVMAGIYGIVSICVRTKRVYARDQELQVGLMSSGASDGDVSSGNE